MNPVVVAPRVENVARAGPCWDWMPEHNSPTLRCPNGHIEMLDDHKILPDGVVSPSVRCPHEGCGFHAIVRLGGWRAMAERVP